MFQKGCEECIIFMDTASQAISAQMEAISRLETAVSGGTTELIADAEKGAIQSSLDCKQALERVRIHQLAHDLRSAAGHGTNAQTARLTAKLSPAFRLD
jgi:hypothetical protein